MYMCAELDKYGCVVMGQWLYLSGHLHELISRMVMSCLSCYVLFHCSASRPLRNPEMALTTIAMVWSMKRIKMGKTMMEMAT